MPPDVAEQQDYNLCRQIVTMWSYSDIAEREGKGENLQPEDYKFMLDLEDAAGVDSALNSVEEFMGG